MFRAHMGERCSGAAPRNPTLWCPEPSGARLYAAPHSSRYRYNVARLTPRYLAREPRTPIIMRPAGVDESMSSVTVRRCPVGAIPNHRSEHRGIVKAKLNTKRCLPLMMQTSGCSICMKSLPGATLRAGGGSQRISTQRPNPGKGHRRPRRFRLAARRAPLRTERKATRASLSGAATRIQSRPNPHRAPSRRAGTDGLIGGMFVLDPSQKHPGIDAHGIRSYITWFITM